MAHEIVNVGIIGTGSIARDQHAPACVAAKNARPHSILSRDLERAQQFAADFSGDSNVKAYTDITSFMADKSLDVVIVASPDALHFEQAKISIEAGKHTLVEKPLTLTSQEGQLLIDIAELGGLAFGVGFHLRWHPGVHVALRLLKDNRIGNIRHLNMRWTIHRKSTSDWRADPRFSRWWSLSGVGAHCIDLMRFFSSELGWTRSSFTASSICNALGSDNEETTAITAIFHEGVSVQMLT